MFQVFPLLHPELPVIEVEGRVFLLDTGATHSMRGAAAPGGGPVVHALTEPAALPFAELAWPMVEHAVRALGYAGPLHSLVGVDRLAALELLVDLPSGFLALRPAGAVEAAPFGETRPLTSFRSMGLPCVALTFGARELRAVIDTGAAMSYFTGAPPAGTVAGPAHADHHPLIGAFSANTWDGELVVASADGAGLLLGHCRMGQLTGLLGYSLELAGLNAALGGALLQSHAVHFHGGLAGVSVVAGGVHQDLGPHYEPMFDDLYGEGVLTSHAEHLATLAAGIGAQRVLDVGAGAGTVSRRLRATGIAVVAVEPSRSLAGQLARSDGAGENPVAVYLGYAESLSPEALPIAPVDLTLFAFGVVDYLLDDRKLVAALRGAFALTRPGGRCFVQPAPAAMMQHADQRGQRYRRQVEVHLDGDVASCQHRVFLDGNLVADELVRFRHRTIGAVAALARDAGWEEEGRDHNGLYPTLRLRRPA